MNQPSNTPGHSNYRQAICGYLRLHQLTVEGRDDSVEADAVRDSLDLPWRALAEGERMRVQGLSADLFSVSEPLAHASGEMNALAQNQLAEALEARFRGDFDLALGLLRQGCDHITPALLSYLRGEIWREAGEPDVAAVFFEHAALLDPDNLKYAERVSHAPIIN